MTPAPPERWKARRLAAFAAAGALLSVGLVAPRAGAGGGERLLEAGPLVGHVTPESALVWAYAGPASATPLAVAFRPAEGGEERTVPMPAPAERHGAGLARLGGLAPATRYAFRVTVGGRSDPSAEGAFVTPPADGSPFKGTIGVVSCMNARDNKEQTAWRLLAAESPALLLHLGDNHYANSTDREVQWAWYLDQRRVPPYADLIRRTSSLAIWDDHDYGANDSDGTLAGKDESLRAFGEVWANPPTGTADGSGVFFKATWGDVDVFMLDVRYHRSPNPAPDDAAKAMLGEAQWAWLEREIAASRATFKLVASGSTLSLNPLDGWARYSHDRRRLFDLVAARKVSGVIALTGDLHASLVVKHPARETGGYPLYEVISSGVGLGGRRPCSFATLAVDTTAEDPAVTVNVTSVDPQGQPARSKKSVPGTTVIRLSELTPAP